MMRNGCPFLVSTKRAILCLSEKVGSTTWKLALLRAQPALSGGRALPPVLTLHLKRFSQAGRAPAEA